MLGLLIFEIFVAVTEVLLVLAAVFSHRAVQSVQRNVTPVATTNEEDGEAEAEQKGQEAGSVGAVQYRLHDLEVATDSFSEDNKLGKGGYGVVYKGCLGGKIVAVKKLFGSSAESDFANEASLLSSLKHANLIKFLGYCCEAGYYLLVYEYASNGDLYNNLINKKKCGALNWEMRFEIIKGFARGLSYLHHNSENVIIHCDLKPANVLLDEYYSAKIADFGLSRAFDMSKTHKTTKQIAGTMGYIAPELFFKQHYSTRSDVYSYGQIVLEILAGCTVQQYAQFNEEALSHVVWKQWKDKRPLREIIDSSLKDSCPEEQLMTCIVVGLLCVQHDPKKRPDMKLVLEMLNSKRAVTAPSIPAFWEGYYDTTIPLQGSILEESQGSILQESQGSILQESQGSILQESRTSVQLQPPLAPKSAIHRIKRGRAAIADGFAANCVPALNLTWWRRRRPQNHFFKSHDEEEEEHFGQLKRFSFQELLTATHNFSDVNVLGRGGFGKVYKGWLADGSLVAVKRLGDKHNAAGELQFKAEVRLISMAVHRNLLKLRGFCITPTESLLVYPYMTNGSLASRLRERSDNVPALDWPTRRRIALGAARGLSYLHDYCNPKIVHRDVKAANILLDEDFEAVVGDFGLSKLMNKNDTPVSTHVCGTIGHLAPEYMSTGKLTEKTDVFAYGIMLLELVTGRPAFDHARLAYDADFMLLDWVKRFAREKRLGLVVDLDLIRNNSPEEVVEPMIQVALICTQTSPLGRPKMSEVVRMLEGDGLAGRWEEWQNVEVVQNQTDQWTSLQESNIYIVDSSTCYSPAMELSDPR